MSTKVTGMFADFLLNRKGDADVQRIEAAGPPPGEKNPTVSAEPNGSDIVVSQDPASLAAAVARTSAKKRAAFRDLLIGKKDAWRGTVQGGTQRRVDLEPTNPGQSPISGPGGGSGSSSMGGAAAIARAFAHREGAINMSLAAADPDAASFGVAPIPGGDGRVIGRVSARGMLKDHPSSGLGGLLVVRPSQLELEMGATPDDMILTSEGAVSSPFSSSGMVLYGLGGHSQPNLGVTSERVSLGDAAPLYGDVSGAVANVVNRTLSGFKNAAASVVNSSTWDKLSPGAKATIAGIGSFLGLKALSKAVTPITMYRLGRGQGADGGESAGGVIVAPSATTVSKSLVDGSRPVSPDAEVLDYGKTWYPVSNNFFAGAYAIGKEYVNRSQQPSFGILAADPAIAMRCLRGLRAPRLYVSDGKIISSSAPYTRFMSANELRRKCTVALDADPMAGGILSSLASGALSKIVEVAKTVWDKIKSWLGNLFKKIGDFFRRIFGPKTHYAARYFSEVATPLYIAARFWQLMGKIPESVLSQWEDEIKDEVEYLLKLKDKEADTLEEADAAIKQLRKKMEEVRVNAGIPSEVSWNEGPLPSDDDSKRRKLSPILSQYAPKSAAHVQSLVNESPWNVHCATSSYNPPIMFTDQTALEQDVRKAARDAQAELDLREMEQKKVTPGEVVQGGGASAGSGSGSADVTGSPTSAARDAAGTSSTVVASTTSGAASDPTILASVVGNLRGGSLDSIPRSWVAQMPSVVQQEYYGTRASVENPDSLVGDPKGGSFRCESPYARRRAALLVSGCLNGRDRVLPMREPLTGFAPAIAAAAKTFATWVLPGLLTVIPWSRVSDWFAKNKAKAQLALRTAKGNAGAVASLSSRSGGFLGALSGALKWVAQKGGRLATSIVRFAARNPKLAFLVSAVAACFAMGSAYSGKTSEWAKLLSLLTDALRELRDSGYITAEECSIHESALSAMSDRTDLTELEAQELQTVMTLCALAAATISEGGGSALDNYPALKEVSNIINSVRDAATADLSGDGAEAMESAAQAIIATYASQETPEHMAGQEASQLRSSSISPAMNAALAAAGGSLVGATVGTSADSSTDSPTTRDDVVIGDTVTSPEGLEAGSVIDRMTPQQAEEFAALADSVAAMPADVVNSEISGQSQEVLRGVTEFLQKWGLPVGAATGLAAAVLLKARSKGLGDSQTATSDYWSGVSDWWRRVVSGTDPSASGECMRDAWTEVAL